MKALLLKDCLQLRQYGKTILLYIGIAICIAISNPEFAICYTAILLTSIAGRQQLMDLRTDFARLLFSWPFTRITYVLEKYLFSIGLSFLAEVVLVAILVLFRTLPASEMVQALAVGMGTALVFVIVMIPMYFKFENNTPIAQIILAAAFLVVLLYMGGQNISLPVISRQVLITGATLLLAAALGGSFWLSCHFLKNKAF